MGLSESKLVFASNHAPHNCKLVKLLKVSWVAFFVVLLSLVVEPGGGDHTYSLLLVLIGLSICKFLARQVPSGRL